MRFGHDLHRHTIPEWSQYYADYASLKRLTKCSPTSEEVYSQLNTTIGIVESFFQRHIRSLDASEADLCYLFGLGSGPQTIPNVAEVNPSEVTHIVETYRRFQHDLKRLHWFIRVNTEAVTRILAKLVRNGEGKESSLSSCQARFNELQPTLEGQVMSRIARIGGLVDNANNSLARSKGAAGKSIYLIRAIRQNHCPRLVTEVVLEALQAGDVDQVLQLIISANADSYASEPNFLPLVHDLLKFSTLFRPSRLTALFALLPLSERCIIEPEVFTWSIIGLGQTQKLGNVETELQAVFESFNIETRESSEILLTKDSSGRLPLHYAAMYRLDLVCEQILQALRSRPGEVERALLSTDNEGMTPLHLAVSSNCKSTAKLMIAALLLCTGSKEKLKVSTVMGDVFNFALQHQNNKIISDSHFSSADLSIQSSRGETILHTAAQLGQADCVSLILNIMHSRGTGFDMPNTSQGWTPLFMASVHGHYDIVRLLLQAGSNQHVKDHRGWTAKEYAVFKGHLAVASLFKASHNGNVTGGPASSVPARRASHPIANIGQGEKVIIASLGTNRIDRVVTELDLAYCSSKHTPDTYDSLPFVLEVSAPGSTCGPRRVRLPILDDRVNDPFVFPIAETVSPQLVFKVFHLTGKPGEEVLVGSGAALLDSNTRQFGTQRQSLVHDQSVPILDAKTMSVSGTITFISFIAKSFPHLQDPQSIDYLARDFPTAPVLVGHRGLGQNVKSHDHLQLGENTIESFLAAATLGASFVEFDVQLTRDFKTVAFHDFSLSESGTDVAIHDLTLDQFLHASNIQSPHGDSLPVPGEAQSNGIPSRPRSRSLDTKFEAGADQTRDRMKHTVDFQQKGFKPNTRGDSIQGSFATLEEILAKLPQDIGCDIEIKHPRLHEAVDAGVAPVAVEFNAFVDTSLEVLHRHAGQRRIILSSFTPEICILLSMKQKAYPVFFITNAGKVPMSDMEVRAASIQVAVKFAQRWHLAGVVFACDGLLLCPRLFGYLKARGLLCATYGSSNNEPAMVKLQAEAGVDIIVVDQVGLIAKAMTTTSFPNGI